MNNKTQQPTELTVHETPQDDAGALIARAIDKNVSVDVMERLLTIRRELKQEKAKEEFDHAMASFQAECPTIEKTKKVLDRDKVTVRYKYAPLESIIEQVKSLLAKHGFSYTMDTIQDDKMLGVICKATHRAGHTQETTFSVPLGTEQYMSDVQKYGARLTFAKRYAFCNAFGILTGDEDTDAQTHTQQIPQYQQKRLESYPTGRYNNIEMSTNLIPPVREENGLTYEPTDDAQIQQPANLYAGKSLAALKVEISQLMHQEKIEKDFAKLGKLTREEAIEILQKVGK